MSINWDKLAGKTNSKKSNINWDKFRFGIEKKQEPLVGITEITPKEIISQGKGPVSGAFNKTLPIQAEPNTELKYKKPTWLDEKYPNLQKSVDFYKKVIPAFGRDTKVTPFAKSMMDGLDLMLRTERATSELAAVPLAYGLSKITSGQKVQASDIAQQQWEKAKALMRGDRYWGQTIEEAGKSYVKSRNIKSIEDLKFQDLAVLSSLVFFNLMGDPVGHGTGLTRLAKEKVLFKKTGKVKMPILKDGERFIGRERVEIPIIKENGKDILKMKIRPKENKLIITGFKRRGANIKLIKEEEQALVNTLEQNFNIPVKSKIIGNDLLLKPEIATKGTEMINKTPELVKVKVKDIVSTQPLIKKVDEIKEIKNVKPQIDSHIAEVKDNDLKYNLDDLKIETKSETEKFAKEVLDLIKKKEFKQELIAKYNKAKRQSLELLRIAKKVKLNPKIQIDVKSPTSVINKIYRKRSEGKPNYSLSDINDFVRGTMVFDTYNEAMTAIEPIKDKIIKIEDFIDKPSPLGYRGINLDVKLKDGTQVELQAHTLSTYKTKDVLHILYTDKIRGKAVPKKTIRESKKLATKKTRKTATEKWQVGVTNVMGEKKQVADKLVEEGKKLESAGKYSEAHKKYVESTKSGIKEVEKLIEKTDVARIKKLQSSVGLFFGETEPTIYSKFKVKQNNVNEFVLQFANLADKKFIQTSIHFHKWLTREVDYGIINKKLGISYEPAFDITTTRKLTLKDNKLLNSLFKKYNIAGATIKPDGSGLELYNLTVYNKNYEQFTKSGESFIRSLKKQGLVRLDKFGTKEVRSIADTEKDGVTTYEQLRRGMASGVEAKPTKAVKTTVEKPTKKYLGEKVRAKEPLIDKYLYHGTNEAVLDNIVKKGIKPSREGTLSLSKNENYAKTFAKQGITPQGKTNPVMFRVKSDLLKGRTISSNKPRPKSDELYEILTKETIPPNALEIKKDGKWISLLEEIKPKKEKDSKVAKSMEAKAIEKGITESFKDLAGFTPITIKNQAKRVAKIMEDINYATKMVLGEVPLEEGVNSAALVTAMENYAMETKNGKLIKDIANSPLTAETSEAAQTLRMLREREKDSATAKIAEIKKAREKVAERRRLGNTKKKVKDTMKKKIKEKVKKNKYDWTNLIDEITC